jgi:hypothetical protein
MNLKNVYNVEHLYHSGIKVDKRYIVQTFVERVIGKNNK